MTPLEVGIRKLTMPVDGQYPRPWMTKMTQPENASIFIVGGNQAKRFDAEMVGDHDRFIDALWNRNGLTCREMYNEVTGGKSSPTRRRIDQLTCALEAAGMNDVLETNATCFSTPMSRELANKPAGRRRGADIFEFLVKTIKPRVVIVHGVGASKECAKALGHDPKTSGSEFEVREVGSTRLLLVPTLASPGFRRKAWDPIRDRVVSLVRDSLAN